MADPIKETEILGYVSKWVVFPGESVGVKVSTHGSYEHELVRLIQGHQHEKAPQVKYEAITEIPKEKHQGRVQISKIGSYGVFPDVVPTSDSINLKVFFYPTLLQAKNQQTLACYKSKDGKSGFELIQGESDTLVVKVGSGTQVTCYKTDISLLKWRWFLIDLGIDSNKLKLTAKCIPRVVQRSPPVEEFSVEHDGFVLPEKADFFFAASRVDGSMTNFLNGRLDFPTLKFGDTTSFLFDFSLKIPTAEIVDTVSGKSGYVVNAPTRAIRAHDWDGSESDWTKADYGYGAIHFHEDDLDDAAWEDDFSLTVPDTCRSGAYAVKVTNEFGYSDYITLFVKPKKNVTARPKVAMVLSTFTYMAYANEHMYDEEKPTHMAVSGELPLVKDRYHLILEDRLDIGLACYDVHRDLSGAVYSSYKRPILNTRFGYTHWSLVRPREFSADLLMVNFIEEALKLDYDILTDHQLNEEGVEALKGYNTVITGCHPEYHTIRTYGAYTNFAKLGGNIMYLGGNGFYWVCGCDPEEPHRIEVRRGDQGCRSYGLPGGERMNSIDGKQGGLWRSRGLAANYLVGVGCCAFGTGPGVAYKRVPHTESLDWIWKDISNTVVGEEGFGGGASGDEIDRADPDLGTPVDAVVVATSVGHSDDFALFNEDQMFPMVNTLGTQTDKVRSDIVYYDTAFGGSVFSVGSINWYASMGYNKYDNDIARLTKNVLLNFSSRG